ncbi:MAG: hypothetical protein JNK27_15130 [Chitinophagaceae bacterium]|nr:hypothetical protein [Chitinophagaceae bacterium]
MYTHISLRSIANCYLLFAFLLLQTLTQVTTSAQGIANVENTPANPKNISKYKTASERLSESLLCFEPVNTNASYSITLCADLPDNNNPGKVHVKSETGHVFIILRKWTETDTINSVFGFYPRRPASSLLFKNVRSEILSNNNREYNISLSKKIEEEDFRLVIKTAVELAKRKYNINKYNCYDYAIEIFNSIAGLNKIPIRHIRFPFIFGKGGSPCSLYADLKEMKNNGSVWAPFIQTGVFRAPLSSN